jgi:hypothetical protein
MALRHPRFTILRRGMYGTFHSVSEQQLQRYVDEFAVEQSLRPWRRRL